MQSSRERQAIERFNDAMRERDPSKDWDDVGEGKRYRNPAFDRAWKTMKRNMQPHEKNPDGGWPVEERHERDARLEAWEFLPYKTVGVQNKADAMDASKSCITHTHRFVIINWLEDNGYQVGYYSSREFLIINDEKILSLVTRKWRNRGRAKWYHPNFYTIVEFCEKYID